MFNAMSKPHRLHKQILRDTQKRIKPGECQKHLRMVLDDTFLSFQVGQDLVQLLGSSELKIEVRQLPLKNCIIWERNVGQRRLETGIEINKEWQMESPVVKVVNRAEACVSLDLQTAFPNCQYTLAVLEPLSSKNAIQLQLFQNLHVEQLGDLNQAKELHDFLLRHFKAIAETPYKQQRNAILGSFKKYLANDKKQCVRIEGNVGKGCWKRLWQQHLNRLPFVALEVADAIISRYPCPKNMLQHFQKEPAAQEILANVKIKRGQGPHTMQIEKRIGNVLSNKLYTLFNARNGNSLI